MADEKDIKAELKVQELQKVRADFIKKELEAQEKLTKLKNKYVSELDLEIQRRKTVAELDEEYVDALMATNESLKSQLETRKQNLEKAIEEGKITAQQQKADEEKIAHLEAMNALTKEQREELAKEYSERVKINQEFEKTVGHATAFGKRMTGLLGLGIDFGDTFIGGLANSGKLMLDLTANSKNLGAALSGKLMSMGPQLLGLVATRTEELFTATDSLVSGFVRATGANEEFRDSLIDGMNAARGMGLSIQNAGVATQALFESTVAFRRASAQGRESMILFTSTLEQAGVDSQATARNIQILSKTLNIAGEDAAKEASKLVTLATSIGRPISQVSADFAEAASTISAHGQDMMQVFSELSAASEATGLSMGNLLGIAAQFDTFDSAASAVGRLNSIMGGPYLNSIEMVYMSESERIRAMLEATELSGVSFESMSRLERRAFAAAAGITDMAQANELFSGGLAAYDDAQARADLNAASQEKLAELAKESTTMFENLANSLNGLAVSMAPLINVFRGFIDLLTLTLNFGKEFAGGTGIVSWAIMLGGALKGLRTTIRLLGNAFLKDAADTAVDTASKGVNTAATEINTAAQNRGSLATLRAIALKLKDIAVEKARSLSQLASAKSANILSGALKLARGSGALLMAGIGKIGVVFKSIGAIFAVVGKGIAVILGGLSLPVVLAVAAIGVLAAVVYNYWDEIKEGFGMAMDWISNKWNAMINFFTDGIKNVLGMMGLDFTVAATMDSPAGPPGMQEGGVLTQGSAIVGETAGGPELLTNTPAGPKITPLPGGGKGMNSGANLVAALQENTATMKAMMAATGGGGGEGGDRPAEIVVNMGTQQLRLAARVLNGAINNLPEKDIALRYDGVGRA